MLISSLICIALLCTLAPLHPGAGEQQAGLTIEQVMTPQELQESGIAGLTAAQRTALNRWLVRYTTQVVQIVRAEASSGAGPSEYASTGGGHWIKETSAGGRLITLEDGSLWEVASIDRIYTGLWLPISNITVIVARNPIGDYKYQLINTDDGEKALVKLLSR